MSKHESISVYDYDRIKLCDLYDSHNDLIGQAYDITVTQKIDGTHTLEFKIPYIINSGHIGPTINAARYGEGVFGSSKYGIAPYKFDNNNFRWDYLKNDFLIRYTCDNKNIWFVANKPQKNKIDKKIYGLVVCDGFESLLKTRGIYKVFDDSNGIGTISYIMSQILSGTGWTYDSNGSDTIFEKDGTTEKIRSLKDDGKKGAIDLITETCNLFQARPIYDTDSLTVTIKSMNNRDQILEGEVGKNLSTLSEKKDSSNIATRVYIEGEYGDYGYVGIDDVKVDSNGNIDPNGTEWGLPFLLNFDYYRELGMFKQSHETALDTYLTNIRAKKKQISQKGSERIVCEDTINELVGQCKLVVYYKSHGYTTPEYVYGDMTAEQKFLSIGDDVVILNNNMTCTYTTWPSNPSSVMSNAYGVAKFVTKAAGKIGAAEVQIESKEKTIESIQRKINALSPTSPKIAEYQSEISNLQTEINNIRVNSLYGMLHSLMKSNGYLYDLKTLNSAIDNLNAQQDDIEADFIVAMGFMLRDGYWSNTNYIPGQENLLYADGQDMSREMGKPSTDYLFNYVRVAEDFDIPMEDIQINAIFKIYDPELKINEKMYIKSIMYGVDNKSLGKIEVSNQDITLTGNDLGSLLSRMSQLADMIDQKNAMYDRAKAISADGSFFAKRLEGEIDVLKTKLLSTVSNWYTDESGNIIFVAADESSAMMLCGAGFMIANSKDDQNNWNWRTFGTGSGFTADEIVAGFISADRIEAGSISVSHLGPNVGNELSIANNTSITTLNGSVTTINNQFAPAFVTTTNYSIGDYVMYNNQLYKFTANHNAGNWTGNDVVAIQTSTMVSDYVSRNAYEVVTGIDIDSAGIQITGAKYVKIKSGATFDVDSTNFQISSTNQYIKTGDWKIEPRGLVSEYYNATAGVNCRIIYGRSGYVFSNDVPQTYVFSQVTGKQNNKYSAAFSLGVHQPGSVNDDASLVISAIPGLNTPRLDVYASYFYGSNVTNISSTLGSSTSNKWNVYGNNVYSNWSGGYSSREIKHDIKKLTSIGERLDQLEPVSFVYDDDADERQRMGLIYEDTIEVMPEICTQDETNKAISYVELVPALLKEIQDLRKRVAELERR